MLSGALGGGIVMFLLGYLFFGLALADFFVENAGSATGASKGMDEINFPLLFIGHVAMALLITIIYGRWASIKTFATGAKAGAVIGLLTSEFYDLA